MEITINEEVAKKVLKIVDKGLVNGLGEAIPGKMCVEAAVCYAMGLPHGDNPPCVGTAVRSFKITLNDQKWPTDKNRTKGMRQLAIAQLGSNEINQEKFVEVLGFNCLTRVLPMIIKNAIEEDKDNEFVKKNVKMDELRAALSELETAKNLKTAKAAGRKVRDIYSAYAYAYDYSSASAYAYAYASAYASAYAYSSAYAYAYAYSSASASAYAYASASASAEKNQKFHLKVLNLIAECGLDALKELKSPGVQWLGLCKK